jgi:hypothetical protein
MKNFFKFLGIISLVLVIGFAMAGCGGGDDDGGGNTGNTGPTWNAIYAGTGPGSNGIPAGRIIKVIAFGGGKFMAGGDMNNVFSTSTDGKAWTGYTFPTISTAIYGFGSITYAKAGGTDDIYIVSGGAANNNTMRWSSDLNTWTAITNSQSISVNGIAFGKDGSGNDLFVAVGQSGKMMTSTDGKAWAGTIAASTFPSDSTGHITAIAYGKGSDNVDRFVAVGANGKAAWSDDGATWNAVTIAAFGTESVLAMTYGKGLFVAVGTSGKMATSADGKTWAAVDSKFSGDSIYAIAYGKIGTEDRFVAGGWNGTVAWSKDGTTWTKIPGATPGNVKGTSTFTAVINSIAFGEVDGKGIFVAVGGGGHMAWSDN